MDITEDNYVAGLQAKNEKALKFFIEHDGWIVKSIVHKMMAKYQDKQEECMNDIFFGIWNNIGSFDPKRSSFKSWAAGVARFQAIDYLRRYGKQLQQESWEEVELSAEDENLNRLVEREISRETRELLDCLKPKDREIFARIFIQDQDVETVSMEMGLPRAAVYNKISRGKKKLRSLAEGSRE